eukprot:1394498-Amorphochlora_amoeboformis.AAC.1
MESLLTSSLEPTRIDRIDESSPEKALPFRLPEIRFWIMVGGYCVPMNRLWVPEGGSWVPEGESWIPERRRDFASDLIPRSLRSVQEMSSSW